MKKLICAVLMFQMVSVPKGVWADGPSATSTAPAVVRSVSPVEPNAMIRLIRKAVSDQPGFYYTDADLVGETSNLNQQLALEGVNDLRKQIADPSITLDSIRQQLVHQTVTEEEAQQVELRFVIARMAPETLDQLFETSMLSGNYSQELRQDYFAAYKADEKREVVYSMALNDLQNVKSVTLKKLGLLSREQLDKELSSLQSLLSVKGRDTWKIVLIVVLATAAAGFASWAIVSATQARWDRKTQKLDADEQQRRIDLGNDYQNREVQLQQNWHNQEAALQADWANRSVQIQAMFAERARLRDQGYVWTICSTTTTQKTVSCSYDYATHTGSEVCVTRCLKSPTTGDMAQQSTQCSSAYIPNNCFQTNPYTAGYNAGYPQGYNGVYDTAYDRAYNSAYHDYYNSAYSQGNDDGNYDGYYDGVNDGHSDGAYYGADDGYNNGYDLGYSDGYDVGWDEGAYEYPVTDKSLHKKKERSVSTVPAGPRGKEGYRAGYNYGRDLAAMLKIGV